MALILDKIARPSAAPRVSRRRLLDRLHHSLDCCSATLVNGRAGTGKTTLAADFARDCGRRTAWYKVEASDAGLGVFLRYLAASVSRQRPGFGGHSLAGLLPPSPAPQDVPVLAEAFVFELQESGGEPLLVVIDDLHLVYDAEWVAPFFVRLLPLLPADVHALVTCRSLPPAPLWRMRSKQSLCVVEEAELAFTGDEAEALLSSYGVPAGEAAPCLAQTRGRAAALDELASRLGAPRRGRAGRAGAARAWPRALNLNAIHSGVTGDG